MKQKLFKIIPVLLILMTPFGAKSQYNSGVITSKLDPSGQLLWVEYGGDNGPGINLIHNICSDINTNVYIVGEATWGIGFEGIYCGGLFVTKYDSLGNLKWANSLQGGTMEVKGVVTDSSENCYVMGRFSDIIVSGACWVETNADWDVFVAKYDKYGKTIWIKSVLTRDYWIKPEDISINEKYNQIYITGWEDSLFMTPNNNSKLILAKIGLPDCNLLKEIAIAKNTGSPTHYKNAGYGIANDGSAVYVTGSLKNSGKYGDMYLAKFDTSLNIIWEEQFGEDVSDNIGYDITLDDEKNVYITGFFSKSVTFGSYTLNPSFGSGVALFIAKFNEDGVPLWAKSADSFLNYDFGYSICFDNKNSVWVSGYIGEGAEFTPSIHTEKEGPFLAKLNKNGDYEFVKSYYTGYDNTSQRGTGYVACNKNGDLFFTTHFLHSLSLGLKKISSNFLNSNLKVFPNPNNGIMNLEFNSNTGGAIQIQVYDILGQEVCAVKRDAANGINNYRLDLSFLQPGGYLITVAEGQTSVSSGRFYITK